MQNEQWRRRNEQANRKVQAESRELLLLFLLEKVLLKGCQFPIRDFDFWLQAFPTIRHHVCQTSEIDLVVMVAGDGKQEEWVPGGGDMQNMIIRTANLPFERVLAATVEIPARLFFQQTAALFLEIHGISREALAWDCVDGWTGMHGDSWSFTSANY